MDQCVIRSLRAYYRKKVVRFVSKQWGATNCFQGLVFFKQWNTWYPWNAVSKETIINILKKSNISQSNQQAAVNDDDDPFKSFQEVLEKFHELDKDAIQPNLWAESFADLDSEVVSSVFFSNMIIAKVIEGENEEGEGDQDDAESTPLTPPSTNQVEDALERLQDFPCSVRAGAKFAPLSWTWKVCGSVSRLIIQNRVL